MSSIQFCFAVLWRRVRQYGFTFMSNSYQNCDLISSVHPFLTTYHSELGIKKSLYEEAHTPKILLIFSNIIQPPSPLNLPKDLSVLLLQKLQIVGHHALHLRLITRQLKPKDLLRPRTIRPWSSSSAGPHPTATRPWRPPLGSSSSQCRSSRSTSCHPTPPELTRKFCPPGILGSRARTSILATSSRKTVVLGLGWGF